MSDYDGTYDSEDEYETEEEAKARYEKDRDECADDFLDNYW